MDIYMILREFIKKQRKLHNMNQVDLSRRAGGPTFYTMEQGKQTLRMDKVNQVLHLFGKTLGLVDWRPEVKDDMEDS